MKEDLLLLLSKVIQYSLTITNPQGIQSYLIYVFELISSLRTLSYVFQPIVLETSNYHQHINLISYIGRPHLLFYFNEQFTYPLALLYILILIFQVGIIRVLHRQNNRKQNDSTLISDNIYFKIGNILFKYNIISSHYLMIFNIMEYALININSVQILVQIINYFILTIIIANYCFTMYFLKQSILLQNNILYDLINTSNLDNLVHVLSILQMIVFRYETSGYKGIIYQTLISLCISSIQIFAIRIYQTNSNKKLANFKIIMNIIIVCVSLQTFVSEYFNASLNYIYIYIIPLLIFILLQTNHQELIKLFNDKNTITTSELRYLTSQYIKFYQEDTQQSQVFHVRLLHLQLKVMLSQQDKTNSQVHDFLIQKILMRYKSNVGKKANSKIDIGAIQLLVQTDRLLEGYQLINSILNNEIQSQKFMERQNRASYQLSFKHKNYLKVLFDLVRDLINENMISKPNAKLQNGDDISQAIQELIHLENTKSGIVQDIQYSVKQKIKVLNFLLTGQPKSNLIQEYTRVAIDFIYQVSNKLQRRYKQFTTLENQKYLLFFQLEVLSDYQDAFEISQLNAMEDDIKRTVTSSLISQLTKSTYYAMITEIIDTKNIIISHTTSNINQLVNHCLIGNQINLLIPNFALSYHHTLVEQFFQQGVNKYFQKLDNVILQIAPNLNTDIDMIMDINRKQTNSIEIIILLKPLENSTPFMILNSNFEIQDISQKLVRSVYSHTFKSVAQYYNQVPVHHFIPNLQKNLMNCFQNVNLRVPTFHSLQSQTSRYSMFETWKNIEQFQDVMCSIILEKNQVGENISYKITFSDFSQIKDTPAMVFSENVLIDIPFEVGCKQTDQNITNRESMNLNSMVDQQYAEQLLIKDINPKDLKVISQQQLDIINEEQQEGIKQHLNFDPLEIGSCMSSVGALKQSKFYKHFQIIHLFASSKRQNHVFFRLKLVILLYFLIVVLENAMLLDYSNKINSLTNDIALLSIKNDVLQPIENFLVTRYTIVNYNGALGIGQINATYQAKLFIFPRSNLGLGYTNSKSSILSILDLPSFQPFLKDRYFQVSMMSVVNSGYLVKYNFRSVMEQYLIYQYQFWFAYTYTAVDISAPYFYYCYANYLMIYNAFDDLNNYVLSQSQASSSNLQSSATVTLIPFKLLYFSLTVWLLVIYNQYGRVYNKLYNLFTRISKEQINFELKRLQKLDQQITKFNFINVYYPDVLEKENELIQKQDEFASISEKNQRSRWTTSLNTIGYLVIMITITMAIILTSIVNASMNKYYNQYSQTIVFYKQISDLGVDIPTIYAQREILYASARIPYFTPAILQDLRTQILICVNRSILFQESLQNFASSHYLFEQQAVDYLQNITTQNLCNYLSADFIKKAGNFCNQTISGALTKGLQITLTYIINSITTEYAINKFNSRTIQPILELEGIFLASQSIQTVLHQMKSNIQTFTTGLQHNIQLICAVCLTIQTIFTIAILTLYDRYEYKKYLQLKKLIYLFPQCTLLYDQTFHRDINSLIVLYQIR